MKKILGLILILALAFGSCAEGAVVTATGHGSSERTALTDAMRKAIESEVGVYIDSSTYVENYKTINDRIYTQADGYVRSYEIISRDQSAGMYTLTIRADVASDALRSDLMTYVQKKAVIGANMMDPRVGVVAVGEDGAQNVSLENFFISGLQENGFTRLVDLNQVDAAVKRRIMSAAFEGDTALRNALLTQYHVDYLVKAVVSAKGKDMNINIPINDPNSPIKAISLGDFIPDLKELSRSEVTLSVRMLNVNTGEIVYAGSKTVKETGSAARDKALQKAARSLMAPLADSALKKAANPEQHVRVTVTQGALGTMTEVYQKLKALPGVTGVFTRSSQGNVIEVDVNFLGTAYDLAVVMEKQGILIKEMNSEYIKI